MPVDILKIIAGQDAARQFVREHIKKGPASIGFGDLEPKPLITETVEVRGKTVLIETDDGVKKVSKRSRIVTLENGRLEVIKGGTNSSITEEDAYKILPHIKKKIVKSLAS